jgi:hypothetical protein
MAVINSRLILSIIVLILAIHFNSFKILLVSLAPDDIKSGMSFNLRVLLGVLFHVLSEDAVIRDLFKFDLDLFVHFLFLD